jgi:hypothetical protein
MENYKYTACSPPSCSCPILEVIGDAVFITDDEENMVQMTYKEMKLIAVKFLDETGTYSVTVKC